MLPKLAAGEYTLEERMMLDVRVMRGSRQIFQDVALNDAVVTKGAIARVVSLKVYADDVPMSEFSGDGVIVCTPTGSTAYSLSAGGPILEPGCDCLSFTPICPHSLWIKSFVVPGDRKIGITPTKWKVPVLLSVDGYQNHNLAEGESVIVCRSRQTVPLIRLNGPGFYQRIAIKLS